MLRTFYETFTLDNGKTVTVEWGWDGRGECVIVESVWDESSGSEEEIELSADENERFDAQALALDPFPPHEPHHEDWV